VSTLLESSPAPSETRASDYVKSTPRGASFNETEAGGANEGPHVSAYVEAAAPRVVSIPSVRSVTVARTFIRQNWEGTVLSMPDSDGMFKVLLRDLTDSSRSPESARIHASDVPKADRPLLSIGAVFYLFVGARTSEGGQLTRVAEIRFRRVPSWTASALAAAKTRAEALTKAMNTSDATDGQPSR
jgi:hypothetical protein